MIKCRLWTHPSTENASMFRPLWLFVLRMGTLQDITSWHHPVIDNNRPGDKLHICNQIMSVVLHKLEDCCYYWAKSSTGTVLRERVRRQKIFAVKFSGLWPNETKGDIPGRIYCPHLGASNIRQAWDFWHFFNLVGSIHKSSRTSASTPWLIKTDFWTAFPLLTRNLHIF